ncbi:hypothetical protein SAMN05428970_0311 [Agromyces sp. CF514]|nr:hypothetical protein SAMN05428970_0311 [Agromyces sp. CF514]
MSMLTMAAGAAGLALILPLGGAPVEQGITRTAFFDSECFSVDTPVAAAATLCLQEEDAGQSARWALTNNTEWVLDLYSPNAWTETIEVEDWPSLTDLKSYFTRLWTNDRDYSGLPVQPDETAYMPAPLSWDGTVYPFPEGELRYNAEATAAMITLASALTAADDVATKRSNLYRIVKRAKACASEGAAALLAIDQTADAYDDVLASLATYSACKKYFKGVAKQAQVKIPASSWRVVAQEFGDNFFIQARNAVIKLLQFR